MLPRAGSPGRRVESPAGTSTRVPWGPPPPEKITSLFKGFLHLFISQALLLWWVLWYLQEAKLFQISNISPTLPSSQSRTKYRMLFRDEANWGRDLLKASRGFLPLKTVSLLKSYVNQLKCTGLYRVLKPRILSVPSAKNMPQSILFYSSLSGCPKYPLNFLGAILCHFSTTPAAVHGPVQIGQHTYRELYFVVLPDKTYCCSL